MKIIASFHLNVVVYFLHVCVRGGRDPSDESFDVQLLAVQSIPTTSSAEFNVCLIKNSDFLASSLFFPFMPNISTACGGSLVHSGVTTREGGGACGHQGEQSDRGGTRVCLQAGRDCSRTASEASPTRLCVCVRACRSPRQMSRVQSGGQKAALKIFAGAEQIPPPLS